MKTKFLFILLALSFFIGACRIYTNYYSDYNRSIDFKSYKTFAWLPDSGASIGIDSFRNTPYDNDIIRNNTKNYITHCLDDRGLRLDTDSPDALFQLVLLNENRERIITQPHRVYPYYYNNPYYYPYYFPYYDMYTYYGWGWHTHYYGVDVYRESYVRGTITINMFDRKLKQLVWTGSAEGDIYDPAYLQYDIHPAIERIMRSFPVEKIEPRKEDKNQPLQNVRIQPRIRQSATAISR